MKRVEFKFDERSLLKCPACKTPLSTVEVVPREFICQRCERTWSHSELGIVEVNMNNDIQRLMRIEEVCTEAIVELANPATEGDALHVECKDCLDSLDELRLKARTELNPMLGEPFSYPVKEEPSPVLSKCDSKVISKPCVKCGQHTPVVMNQGTLFWIRCFMCQHDGPKASSQELAVSGWEEQKSPNKNNTAKLQEENENLKKQIAGLEESVVRLVDEIRDYDESW